MDKTELIKLNARLEAGDSIVEIQTSWEDLENIGPSEKVMFVTKQGFGFEVRVDVGAN